jgi:hypothetical protein
MLQIVVPETELFDEKTETFIHTKDTQLKLEHSLLSISKWESKWCKPFLGDGTKVHRTTKEMIDYIECMTLNTVPKEVYSALTKQNIKDISDYINSPMTASTVVTYKKRNQIKPDIVTSELIYYWMIACQIPFECEKWHINRLIMLIKICNAKNDYKKMSKREIMEQNRALNEARRKALHTKG